MPKQFSATGLPELNHTPAPSDVAVDQLTEKIHTIGLEVVQITAESPSRELSLNDEGKYGCWLSLDT